MIKIIASADPGAIKCNHGVIYSHRRASASFVSVSRAKHGGDGGQMEEPFCETTSLRDRFHRVSRC